MKIHKILLYLLLLIVFNQFINAQIVQPGEELVYDVSYSGLSLGTVTITTQANQSVADVETYKATCTMKSHPGIPFVALNAIFESWMDKSLSFSRKFVGNYEDKGIWTYQEILFNSPKNFITEKIYKGKEKISSKQTPSKLKWNDGLSLFFLARNNIGSKKNYRLPTYVSDTSFTNINFPEKIEFVTNPFIKYPVRTIRVFGSLNFSGVYGLSGNYEGWFSDDSAKIPIKAKMNVVVGSVEISLKSWKRPGWEPPKK
jgi:hypothetical protein